MLRLFEILPPVLGLVSDDVLDDVADEKPKIVSMDELTRLYSEVTVMRAANLLAASEFSCRIFHPAAHAIASPLKYATPLST